MRRKLISIFTLVAFIMFSLSCYSTKKIELDADAAKMKGEKKIWKVVLKSGEIIEFSEKQPGRIYNGSISGASVKVTGKLDKAYVREIAKDRKGQTVGTLVSIPLSEVEQVQMKEINTFISFLAVVGTALIVLAFAMREAFGGGKPI